VKLAASAGSQELRGQLVSLRPVSEVDLPRLLEILADERVVPWWGVNDERSLREEVESEHVSAWAILVEGEVSGMVEATEELEPDYRNVEVDIFLAPEHWGRGLGADALRVALRHLFEERGHHRATIIPAAANERAIRSYASLGFKPVGILRQSDRSPEGVWRDSLMMDMLAAELR
jgi:aminoglycoside 6'-N-acetyltransferase